MSALAVEDNHSSYRCGWYVRDSCQLSVNEWAGQQHWVQEHLQKSGAGSRLRMELWIQGRVGWLRRALKHCLTLRGTYCAYICDSLLVTQVSFSPSRALNTALTCCEFWLRYIRMCPKCQMTSYKICIHNTKSSSVTFCFKSYLV